MKYNINIPKLLKTKSKVLLEIFKDVESKYLIIGGYKKTQKSFAACNGIIYHMLIDPRECPVVIAGELSKHERTTVPAMKKVMTIGDQYIPGFSNLFKGTKRPNPQAKLISTGQVIDFVLADPDKVSGSELSDTKFYRTKGGYDEPVDRGDQGSALKDKFSKDTGDVLENTLFRHTKDQKVNKKVQIIFTFNLWNMLHWLIRDYVDKYVPFDLDVMEDTGEMTYKGNGFLVARLNYLVNGIAPKEQLAEELMKDGLSKEAALGKTIPFTGTLLANSASLIKVVDKQQEKDGGYPLSIGLDVGSIQNKTSLMLCATSTSNVNYREGGVAGQYSAPDYREIYLENIYTCDMTKSNDVDWHKQAREIIKAIRDLIKTWPTINEYGVSVRMDYQNIHFQSILNSVLSNEFSMLKPYIVFIRDRDKYKHINKVDRREEMGKHYTSLGMINAHRCDGLIEELRMYRESMGDRNVKDHMDAAFYAMMRHTGKWNVVNQDRSNDEG